MADDPTTPAPMTPLRRLQVIREKAFFAMVQNSLAEDCIAVSRDLPIAEREKKLGQADIHFEAFYQTVHQLMALICGDEEAAAQLDMVELQCGALGG